MLSDLRASIRFDAMMPVQQEGPRPRPVNSHGWRLPPRPYRARNLMHVLLGQRAPTRRYAPKGFTRATWEERRRDDIAIEGLEPCLQLFGIA